ncbi:MAG: LLM class flavin-dependent oxidoreductase [Thermomicrobiales bacterium]|nr:LLM class flavin-dependent oxidoreductase [Thermomicrobiales bacterium]
MKFSVSVPRFVSSGGDAAISQQCAVVAHDADQAGIDTLGVLDNFCQISMAGAVADPMLEGYSALAFAAGVTGRNKPGALVTGVLVKTRTTLDVLSGDRAWSGVGAGWNEREHGALGVTFPSTSERFERLEETLQIANQVWSDNDGPIGGKHVRLAETRCQAQPVGHARPPILIGSGGEPETLKLVARDAGPCKLFVAPGEEGVNTLLHKLGVLRQRREAEGRDFASIEKTVPGPCPAGIDHPKAMAPAACARFVTSLELFGIDTHVAATIDRDSPQSLVEAVEPLGVAGALA